MESQQQAQSTDQPLFEVSQESSKYNEQAMPIKQDTGQQVMPGGEEGRDSLMMSQQQSSDNENLQFSKAQDISGNNSTSLLQDDINGTTTAQRKAPTLTIDANRMKQQQETKKQRQASASPPKGMQYQQVASKVQSKQIEGDADDVGFDECSSESPIASPTKIPQDSSQSQMNINVVQVKTEEQNLSGNPNDQSHQDSIYSQSQEEFKKNSQLTSAIQLEAQENSSTQQTDTPEDSQNNVAPILRMRDRKQPMRKINSARSLILNAQKKQSNENVAQSLQQDAAQPQKLQPSGRAPSALQLRARSMNLKLGGSQMDMIQQRGTQLLNEFNSAQESSFHDRYALGTKLGEGMHAAVYKCFKRTKPRPSGETTPLPVDKLKVGEEFEPTPFAVKIVRDDDEEKIIAHKKEFEILKKLTHPNVVGAKEIFNDPFKKEVYQVLEFIEGSEILDEIALAGSYSEAEAQLLYYQVLEAVEYLHSKRVVHRDIKPQNILVTKDKQRAVLADFNVAKFNEGDVKDEMRMITRSAGTMAFVAPERLQEGSGYTEKVDMWAAGLVLYMLLIGDHPFNLSGSHMELFYDIMDGERIVEQDLFFKDEISQNAKDLIQSLIKKDPEIRLSAAQAMEHPWFRKSLLKNEGPQLFKAQERIKRQTIKEERPKMQKYKMADLEKELLRSGLDYSRNETQKRGRGHQSMLLNDPLQAAALYQSLKKQGWDVEGQNDTTTAFGGMTFDNRPDSLKKQNSVKSTSFREVSRPGQFTSQNRISHGLVSTPDAQNNGQPFTQANGNNLNQQNDYLQTDELISSGESRPSDPQSISNRPSGQSADSFIGQPFQMANDLNSSQKGRKSMVEKSITEPLRQTSKTFQNAERPSFPTTTIKEEKESDDDSSCSSDYHKPDKASENKEADAIEEKKSQEDRTKVY